MNSDDEESTAQNLKIKPTQFKAYKQAFKNHRITARDIVLPPFREDYDPSQPTTHRYKTVTSEDEPVEEEKKVEDIIEEAIPEKTGESTRGKSEAERQKQRQEVKEITSNVYDSYLSTPNFLKRLCEIADSLIGITNKKEVLNE